MPGGGVLAVLAVLAATRNGVVSGDADGCVRRTALHPAPPRCYQTFLISSTSLRGGGRGGE